MSYLLTGKTAKWELVVGLEVHCQIISQAKLFSNSSTLFGLDPNSSVSFIDASLPGVLPRLNKFAVEQAIKTGLALNGTINLVSYFDRKHYFYPDSPFGYQITQFYKPIMENGSLTIELEGGTEKNININRLHIEQDAGKLLHEYHPNKSFVDLNRAGVGLMEIVSDPDLRSIEEVAAYVNNLRSLVRALGTCDANMDEGSMRCDVNISVRKLGEEFRTRVEVKNVNSVKFIQKAIEYEANLQIETWEQGLVVQQETKLFDSASGKTYSLRSKEEASDYRYVRDPDLMPLSLDANYVASLKESLPELPHKKKLRFINDYGLNVYDATLISSDTAYANFFEDALMAQDNKLKNPKMMASWLTTNLFAFLNKEGISLENSKVTPIMLAELVDLVESQVISGKIAKDVFETMWLEGKNAKTIVEAKGLQQITNTKELEAIVNQLCNDNEDKVTAIKAGKDKLLGWFVGQVMQVTKGKANPEIVNVLLRKKIFGK
ncbi:Aspartyl/glutamyl-tRNA(Asn/Gln) amidotransferase subunit B [Candidatus Hepatincola sp. Av]